MHMPFAASASTAAALKALVEQRTAPAPTTSSLLLLRRIPTSADFDRSTTVAFSVSSAAAFDEHDDAERVTGNSSRLLSVDAFDSVDVLPLTADATIVFAARAAVSSSTSEQYVS